jgi:hypothetical protein
MMDFVRNELLRTALLAAVLAACGDDRFDIHELTTVGCFGGATECERACAPPPAHDGPFCVVNDNGTPDSVCMLTAEVEGVRGCCFQASGSTTAVFLECE